LRDYRQNNIQLDPGYHVDETDWNIIVGDVPLSPFKDSVFSDRGECNQEVSTVRKSDISVLPIPSHESSRFASGARMSVAPLADKCKL